jgi:hypothetical protein
MLCSLYQLAFVQKQKQHDSTLPTPISNVILVVVFTICKGEDYDDECDNLFSDIRHAI